MAPAMTSTAVIGSGGSASIRQSAQRSLLDVARLRSLRNAVIGSRTRKSEVVAQGKVPALVALLMDPASSDEMKSLAATIIGSLAHAAPSPTLLSLCRAKTTEALLQSLGHLAKRIKQAMSDESTSAVDSIFSQQIRILESYLRALRALLMALADEVAPGTRWERSLGVSGKSYSSGAIHARSISSSSKSAREVIGWHMADAGFDEKAKQSGAQPTEELMLLARQAIANAFQPENLKYWLGALFVAKIPMSSVTGAIATTTGAASGKNSRASSRPGSPPTMALPMQAMLTGNGSSANLSRSSSRMSLASDAAKSASTTSSAPMSASQVRILAIAEMVSGTLSSCLAVTNASGDLTGGGSSATPDEVIAKRRNAILEFVASDSPYWSGSTSDQEITRGRPSSTMQTDMQGSFVKRGHSTEGLGVAMEDVQETERIAADYGVINVLIDGIECGFAKTQEASSWALASLARDNTETSKKLFACTTSTDLIPTSYLLNLRKDPSPSIRLAAFCCLAHIIKVHPFTSRTNECVLSVLIDLMDVAGEVQVAAIFAFARLVADNLDMQTQASERYDCIEKLGMLLESSKMGTEVAEETPENLQCRLREATLSALAALCFQSDDIRRKFVDHKTPSLLPLVVASLSVKHLGIRIAACRLVRALSRSISILRTSLVDVGVAARLVMIMKDESEDISLRTEAIASICNLVLKFSPMKKVLLDADGIPKLVEQARNSTSGTTRLNAMWAIKNILYYSETSLKTQVMEHFGWSNLVELVVSSNVEVQEQALCIVRNICSSRETDIQFTLDGFGGGQRMLEILEEVIWQRKSEDILEQAAYILVNLATGSDDHRRLILDRADLLDAIVYFLKHPRPEVRMSSLWIVTNLMQPVQTPRIAYEAASRLKRFGFDSHLRELLDDPERDVSDRAKDLITRFQVDSVAAAATATTATTATSVVGDPDSAL